MRFCILSGSSEAVGSFGIFTTFTDLRSSSLYGLNSSGETDDFLDFFLFDELKLSDGVSLISSTGVAVVFHDGFFLLGELDLSDSVSLISVADTVLFFDDVFFLFGELELSDSVPSISIVGVSLLFSDDFFLFGELELSDGVPLISHSWRFTTFRRCFLFIL